MSVNLATFYHELFGVLDGMSIPIADKEQMRRDLQQLVDARLEANGQAVGSICEFRDKCVEVLKGQFDQCPLAGIIEKKVRELLNPQTEPVADPAEACEPDPVDRRVEHDAGQPHTCLEEKHDHLRQIRGLIAMIKQGGVGVDAGQGEQLLAQLLGVQTNLQQGANEFAQVLTELLQVLEASGRVATAPLVEPEMPARLDSEPDEGRPAVDPSEHDLRFALVSEMVNILKDSPRRVTDRNAMLDSAYRLLTEDPSMQKEELFVQLSDELARIREERL